MNRGYKFLITLLMLLITSGNFYAQEKTITGTVISEEGDPLIGVNVIVKGTTNGTLTDFDGMYTINTNIGDVLVFSYLGMTTVESPIGAADSINITMTYSNNLLDEVVVVAYGTTTLRESTGAISSVKADEILNESPVVSVQNALQGNVSGIQVGASSGQPGSFPSVRLRGVGSINATNNPLYIIDGIPIVAGDQSNFSTATTDVLSTINPNDIESMTVLKDAASAALYGARAANGVIVITTKKGRQGKTNFEFKSTFGETDLAMHNTDREMVDGDTFRALSRESLYNLFRYVYEMDDATSNSNADDYLEQFFPIPQNGYTDWKDILFRKGTIKQNQFSVRGGTDKTRFYGSVGAHEEEGVVYESDFTRYTVRSSIDHTSNMNLSFGLNTSIAFTRQNSVPDQGLYYANPYSAYLISGNPTDPTHNAEGELLTSIQNQYPNPEYERGLTEQSARQIRISATPYVQVKFLDYFTFKTTNSWDYYSGRDFLYWGPTSNDGSSFNGYAYRAHNTISTLTSSNTLNFVKTFNSLHNVNVMAGYEVNKSEYDDFSADVMNFPNSVLNDFTTAAEELDTDTNFQEDKIISYISRAQYNYDNKYYLSGSIRHDGSSRMSKENRWGTFWSASGAWVVSSDLFEDHDIIDYLKIRASYGTTATYPNSFTGALALYGFSANYNDMTAAFPSQLANANLTWETNKNYDIGLEFELLDNKISGSIEYYNRYTEDLLQDVPILTTTGFASILQNVGEMSNKGFEVSLTSKNFDTEDFKWTTTLTGAHNKNTIEKLYDGEDIQLFPHILREGESRYTYYLREGAGVDPETGRWEWYKNTTDDDGNIISGRETTQSSGEARSTVVGKWDPDFYGGIRNVLNYKDFDLSFLFNYTIGGQSYDSYFYYLNNDGRFPTGGIPKGQLDRWQQPGDVAENPIRIFQNSTNSNFQSNRRLHDTTHLRLKNITLGYNLPESVLDRTGVFTNVRVSLNATNLWTLAKDKAYDPEVRVGGASGTAIPLTKSYAVNVQLQF